MKFDEFLTLPLLPILRGVDSNMLVSINEIMMQTNLKAIEITMNTPQASSLISELIGLSQGRYAVGAGTVLSVSDLKMALEAGASFIVTPVVNIEVISYCRSSSIPVFPGAMTPTEIYEAWKSGATMVKVFPSSILAAKYFEEIRGPFKDIKLLACGGVNSETIKSFFDNGADAIAFGGSIFNLDLLARNSINTIVESINTLIKSYKSINC